MAVPTPVRKYTVWAVVIMVLMPVGVLLLCAEKVSWWLYDMVSFIARTCVGKINVVAEKLWGWADGEATK
jgi:membrane protein YqaA with SNARE-associated domain